MLPYGETESYTLKVPEEVLQQLDDHAVMAQSLSCSPFKKLFEDRINSWQRKLRTAQVRAPRNTRALRGSTAGMII